MDTSTIAQITSHVGIDISKETLDCWLRPAGVHLRSGNDQQGFQRLMQWLTAQGRRPEDTIICMEDTGIYGKRVLLALTEAGWPVAVEKTTITEKVGPEHHRKDDEFDASLIAEYADRFSDRLYLTEAPEEDLERLSQLYSERRRLVRQQAATKTKQTQADQQPHCPELLRENWTRQLQLLGEQIQTLQARMNEIVGAHEGLRSYFRLLESIPGVGEVTAWLWLILFYGETDLDPKKIGLYPLREV